MPWANIPIRLLSDKMVGSEYLPAVNIARQVATREISRVTSDPELKGHLTEGAREAAEQMISGEITIAQPAKSSSARFAASTITDGSSRC